jgi:hypothetical protein
MTEVHTRDEAIASVDQALQVWSTNVSDVLAQAQRVVRAANDEVENLVRKCATEVAAVEALLIAAKDEDRRQLQAKLVRASDARDQARRARVRVDDVASSVSQLRQTHITTSTLQVARARAQLAAKSRALDEYRSGGADLGFAGPSE